MKLWLEKNDIEMYLTHNKGKSVVAEIFIRIVKNTIYRYMSSISKNLFIDKVDNIVNKYNNTYHSAIKMKSVDVKSSTYINSSQKINDKNSKCKIDDIVRISKWKNIFEKDYVPNCPGEVLKVKILLESFTKKNCKNQIRRSLESKK